jgi:hypothetical protein
VGKWDQNWSWRNWLGGCGLDSTSSGQGPVAGCCECGDEPSCSCAKDLVIVTTVGINVIVGLHCYNNGILHQCWIKTMASGHVIVTLTLDIIIY